MYGGFVFIVIDARVGGRERRPDTKCTVVLFSL